MEFDDDAPFRDHGVYTGKVVGDNDPLKQGRVLVTIPGILEPAMWAHCCMPGQPFNRGMFVVPPIGAQVVVQFLHGDREEPIVMGGISPPVVAGGSRSEIESQNLPKMVTIENEDWVVFLGKSETNAPYLDIRSRPKEDGSICRIVIDYDSQIMEVNVPQAISLNTPGLLNLDGRLMQLRQRPVEEGNDPV